MEKAQQPTRFYTAIIKCHFCLRELARVKHLEKIGGIKLNFNECPQHTKSGVLIEWEPEEDNVGTRSIESE